MLKWMKKNSGLTLVEILVSLAILSIIMVPLSSMVLTALHTNHKSMDQYKASQLAQTYMEIIKEEDPWQLSGDTCYYPEGDMIVSTYVTPYINTEGSTGEPYVIRINSHGTESLFLLYKITIAVYKADTTGHPMGVPLSKLVGLKNIH